MGFVRTRVSSDGETRYLALYCDVKGPATLGRHLQHSGEGDASVAEGRGEDL
jgi:hypothetical protein